MSARPYTPEELDRLHAAGLSAVGHYNTPRTESDGEIVLVVLAGNDRYLKPAYCAGIRAEAARMDAERGAPVRVDVSLPMSEPAADPIGRCTVCGNIGVAGTRCDNPRCGSGQANDLARVAAERDALQAKRASPTREANYEECSDPSCDLADWRDQALRQLALVNELRGDLAIATADLAAANERADKAERERDEAKAATLTAEKEKAEREIGRYIDAIRAHLPLYTYDDGTDDEASPVECVEYAGDEIKRLRRDVATLKAEAARVGPLTRAAEAFFEAASNHSRDAATERAFDETRRALLSAALALPVRR